ncbi:NAD-dependent epimerase/dehydratase family protein, partial [Nonomuraea fuscirosea]
MRVLIVGGSGFLGRELVQLCAAAGHEVGATYLSGTGAKATDAEWLRVDVRSRSGVADMVSAFGPEATINAAYRQADWT